MDFVFFFIACLAVKCVLDRSEWDCYEESISSAPWKITRSLNEDCGSALIVWGQISESFRTNTGERRVWKAIEEKNQLFESGPQKVESFWCF